MAMPAGAPEAKIERNHTIMVRAQAGERYVDLAAEYGISPSRIREIALRAEDAAIRASRKHNCRIGKIILKEQA
jgi:Mor family transcriptional regulator